MFRILLLTFIWVSSPVLAFRVDLADREWFAVHDFSKSEVQTLFQPENSIGIRKFPIVASQLFPRRDKEPTWQHYTIGTTFMVTSPYHLQTLVLQIEQIGESWQIILNNALVAENMQHDIGLQGATDLRISRKSKIYLHPKNLRLGENQIVFHVFGRYPIAPDINPNSMLGLGKYTYTIENLNSNYYALFRPNHVAIPVFILAGMFFIILYAIRPEYSYFLYMGLFHVSAALYTTARQGLLDPYFVDRSILIRLEFLSLTSIVPLLILAVHYYFYRSEPLQTFYKSLVGLNLSIFIVFIVLDIYLCQVLLRFWQYVVPINIMAIFLILVKAVRQKREDSILLSLTLFSGSLLVLVDILEALLSLPFAHWSYLGMFCVTISFMIIITNNILRQFKNTKRLNRELNEEKKAISRFVPSNFLNYLNKKSIVEIELGDQTNHSMTILFADIRNFTVLSEDMSPQENFNFINSYLKRVGPIIRKHHGFIDKYIGDGIMALFPENPKDALFAAMEIQEVVVRYNTDRQIRNYQPISVGIGIHYGDLMLGTIGEAERMEGTVISDSVNTASRLESLTKTFESSIIISDTVLQHVDISTTIDIRPLGDIRIKGKSKVITAYEVFEYDSLSQKKMKQKSLAQLKEAISQLRQGKTENALAIFQTIVQNFPEDKVSHYYINLLNHIDNQSRQPLQIDAV